MEMMEAANKAKELHKDFLKSQLEKLRKTSTAINRLACMGTFKKEFILELAEPIHDLAFDLLHNMYIIELADIETTKLIVHELTEYLVSHKYNDTDDFLNWLEEV